VFQSEIPSKKFFLFREHGKITRGHVSRVRPTFQLWRIFLGRKSLCRKCNVEGIAMIKNWLFFLRFCHFSAAVNVRNSEGRRFWRYRFTVDNCLTNRKSLRLLQLWFWLSKLLLSRRQEMNLSTVSLHGRGNFFSRDLPTAEMFPYHLAHTFFYVHVFGQNRSAIGWIYFLNI
jgi:hypothetical protein